MKKIAQALTNYLTFRGVVKKEAYEIYEYGFTFLLETALSIIICLFLALWMDKIVECAFFFLLFIPLRSYAGGFHFEKYIWCLLCSCATLAGVLLVADKLTMPIGFATVFSVIMLVLIKSMYPVENINRPVDEEEIKFFQRKINAVLVFDFLVILVLLLLKAEEFLVLMAVTLLLIVITMFMGKIKYAIQTKKFN